MAVLCAISSTALGQSIEARPRTLVVGSASAFSPAERMDGWRRGLARTPLPGGTLRVAWRRSIGPSIEGAPLVTADGTILVFSGRGDLVELDEQGTERGRVGLGGGPLGPGAVLSDGTVVTLNTAGEVIGVFRSGVRFRTRVGDRGMVAKVAPLALDDGGLVATNGIKGPFADRLASELAALDADGGVRWRARVSEQIVWPLLSTDGGVAGVSASGDVFLWTPGSDPRLVASFGGALDGGAAALDGGTLIGIVENTRLVTVDLIHGIATVSAVAGDASALLGPPSVAGGTAFALEIAPTSTRILAVDSRGRVNRLPVATFAPILEADGTVVPVLAPTRTVTLVDESGTVAFGAPGGRVGVASVGGMSELGEVLCGRGASPPPPSSATPALGGHPGKAGSRPSAGFAGMASAGPHAFLVACENGTVLEVRDPLSMRSR